METTVKRICIDRNDLTRIYIKLMKHDYILWQMSLIVVVELLNPERTALHKQLLSRDAFFHVDHFVRGVQGQKRQVKFRVQ